MPIKNIHNIEQPREKLAKYGPGKLSDSELLAIILRTGPKNMGVLNLSKKIFRSFSDARLANAPLAELLKIKGLGLAKASEILACFELGRRLLQDKKAALILSPSEVWAELKDLRENKKEHFVVFFLNTQNQEIQREIVSVGTLNASLIHPREVFEPAIRHIASHIIVAHNHPSGSLDPSAEDILVTRRLSEAGKIVGIEVLDHVIVTSKGYCSFKERNLMQLG